MATVAEQIAIEIQRQIADGKLAPGDRVPSAADLGRKHDVSAATATVALRLLRSQGLIESHTGRGSYVATPRAMFTRNASERYILEKRRADAGDSAELEQMVAQLDADQLDPSAVEVEAVYFDVDADPDTAIDLGVDYGDRLLERIFQTRVTIDGRTDLMSTARSLIPMALVESNPDLLDADLAEWPGGTIGQLRTVGIEVARIRDSVIARPPTPAEIDGMELDSGVCLLEVTKTSIDTGGRVVEISVSLHPSDRTRLVYTTELPRWPGWVGAAETRNDDDDQAAEGVRRDP